MIFSLSLSQTLKVPLAAPVESLPFKFGTASGPLGEIKADGTSLLRDGKRWIPVMGEFHYARYPAGEWRSELLKLKAGGIDIVSTYVFWIHHEEVKGVWRWDGQRDLRKFVLTCKEVGMPVILRVGPWCHGEVRNGGLPDWLVKAGPTRQDDPSYLAQVKEFYGQIGHEARGLLWKNGGPVVGVQIENEFGGKAEHLLTLKRIALDAGLDVPLYTRTGWPGLNTPMPFGEMLPLYGVYPEGFWDRSTQLMPATYWRGYAFDQRRTDEEIGNERQQNGGDDLHAHRYPFLTCEMGGGMQVSYHRRIKIEPKDIESLALVKIGSGSNLPGYYMAHGGTNPDGDLTTLQESQANREWNDLPVKSYDFQTLLGEFGQTREQYHRLRRLHLFLHDWGSELAKMPALLPAERPERKQDLDVLRWSVRSDGRSGFVFVNNYQRLAEMPPKPEISLRVELPSETIAFPSVTIPSDQGFFWPLNLHLGDVVLRHGTAQPVCRLGDTTIFAAVPGIPAEFEFVNGTLLDSTGRVEGNRAWDVPTGLGSAVRVSSGGHIQTLVLLSQKNSLELYRGVFAGQERLVLSSAPLFFDGNEIQLRTIESGSPEVYVYPPLGSIHVRGRRIVGGRVGLFERFELPWPSPPSVKVALEPVRGSGQVRHVPIGSEGVAEAPGDHDFDQSAVWKIRVEPKEGRLIRIHYAGDVARLYDGDRLVDDNFYNGTPFEFGTWRAKGELTLKVLPFPGGAPIMLRDRPEEDGVARLDGIEVVDERRLIVTP